MNITSTPPATPTPNPHLGRDSLRPDCSNCFALCCTAFGFTRSADFAIDKPAGTPCQNLDKDFSCTIHDRLRPRGFRGCTVFDCFGAGQAVSQRLFDGISWRENPGSQHDMFTAFKVLRQLHEMLWHLAEAQVKTYDADSARQAQDLREVIESIAGGSVRAVLTCDVEQLHGQVRAALRGISDEVRAGYFAGGGEHLDADFAPGADLIGRNLRARSLCGADLRGACLIAADLRFSDLAGADLLGTDLRDARLDGADLAAALFLTQPQLNSARGSSATTLPEWLSAPPHWLAAP
ncbi:pentapeptide repeat-containing protein [Arthrobacter sp. ISL-48]|uniref:pentapeptide repeat-containing protein n=1 Tax=Arthrobacter sp. ISL-48 TaxID=2819110 RepID=UPI001BEA13C4|nr:pentapeptide repeat-containing protein [Arthrobacter sp. ISL-48]MBT2534485.1 pentapeptide repeat-containing protein [Arthrobacter sp. ISL-48]